VVIQHLRLAWLLRVLTRREPLPIVMDPA
jgi:hypothetical protein